MIFLAHRGMQKSSSSQGQLAACLGRLSLSAHRWPHQARLDVSRPSDRMSIRLPGETDSTSSHLCSYIRQRRAYLGHRDLLGVARASKLLEVDRLSDRVVCFVFLTPITDRPGRPRNFVLSLFSTVKVFVVEHHGPLACDVERYPLGLVNHLNERPAERVAYR
jgi:hypothetical protein